jgi:hypothetical protein
LKSNNLKNLGRRMLKLNARIGFVSALLIGFSPLPAQSQSAPSQGGSQNAVVLGNNNQVTQIIYQTIVNKPVRGSGGEGEYRGKPHKYKHKHKQKPHHRRERQGRWENGEG